MTMTQIDTVTGLPIDTTHGITCGRCTSALERRVRHANVAAVRECDRLSRIADEISETTYATEIADAKRRTSPIVPLTMFNAPVGW